MQDKKFSLKYSYSKANIFKATLYSTLNTQTDRHMKLQVKMSTQLKCMVKLSLVIALLYKMN